jgi:hypothetical protein
MKRKLWLKLSTCTGHANGETLASRCPELRRNKVRAPVAASPLGCVAQKSKKIAQRWPGGEKVGGFSS